MKPPAAEEPPAGSICGVRISTMRLIIVPRDSDTLAHPLLPGAARLHRRLLLRRSTFGGVGAGFTSPTMRRHSSGFTCGFLRTLVFAATASGLCLLGRLSGCRYYHRRHTSRFRLLAITLILIPYFSSFLIRVMALTMLMSREGFLETILNALASAQDQLTSWTRRRRSSSHVYAYLPIAVVPLVVVLDRIPKA